LCLAWALFAAYVIYPLSIGPVGWMVQRLGIGSWERFDAVYRPLWDFSDSCGLSGALRWYLELWVNFIHV
jgi:hypothetical protein